MAACRDRGKRAGFSYFLCSSCTAKQTDSKKKRLEEAAENEWARQQAYLQEYEGYVRSAVRACYVNGVSLHVSGASFASPSFDQDQNVMATLANVGIGVAAGLLVTDAVTGLAESIGATGFDTGGGDFGAFEF